MSELDHLEGKKVRVAISQDGFSRNHFGPQIALQGILECHNLKSTGRKYRVLVNDDIFAYFTDENVVLVNTLASVPTIMLKIEVKE